MSTNLDYCNCCSGIKKLTPVTIQNSPGLPSIKYRVGTYNEFLSSMHASLSYDFLKDPNNPASKVSLRGLTTRENSDLAISLLDSWAIVSDVLTFYQERIANEGFLRTATERRSVLELARLIGYELQPGVSAGTFLAFTLENSTVADSITIDSGTKVQSIPGQGEKPQVFETSEQITARREWNNLTPKLTENQDLSNNPKQIYFKGVNTKLRAGDGLLVFTNDGSGSTPPFAIVSKVTPNTVSQQTVVDVDWIGWSKSQSNAYTVTMHYHEPSFWYSRSPLSEYPLPANMSSSEFKAYCINNNLDQCDFAEMINQGKQQFSDNTSATTVYAFRIQAGLFGSTAPNWHTLPNDSSISPQTTPPTKIPDIPDYEGISITTDSSSTSYASTYNKDGNLIFLDNRYPSVMPCYLDGNTSKTLPNWCVLKDETGYVAYPISDVVETTLADFLITGKVTGILLSLPEKATLDGFTLRRTSVFVQSEPLDLDDMPVCDTTIQDSCINLDNIICDLAEGQTISVTGDLVDTTGNEIGQTKSEIATIDQIVYDFINIQTILTLTSPLVGKYNIDTVTINANVARANHGETKTEIIGSGDPSQQNQEFILSQNPLTFTSAPTGNGIQTSLEITVDSINWKEASSLYDLHHNDKGYIVRIDDNGTVHLKFGDGIMGTRPTAGIENISAKYRIGIGTPGMLREGQLSLLMNKPLGVQSVTNPTAPTGAADPEGLNSARQNAPSTILAMERLVSIRDFEDFTLAFPGIGKANAKLLYVRGKMIVYLTISSSDMKPVEPQSDLYMNLYSAINNNKDYAIPFKVDSFIPTPFSIDATILVANDHQPDLVKAAIQSALLTAFSDVARQFGQPVYESEVITVIQQVDGVVSVDLTSLMIQDHTDNTNYITTGMIPSNTAYVGSDGNPVPAKLVYTYPSGIHLTEMSS